MEDIIETAERSGSFRELLKALKSTGLDKTLKGKEGFTVFAPDDDAFRKLPDGTIKTLLNDREKLSDILLFHVVEGNLTSDHVKGIDRLGSIQGSDLLVESSDELHIGDAKVKLADIRCSNGVIHVIDRVMVPA